MSTRVCRVFSEPAWVGLSSKVIPLASLFILVVFQSLFSRLVIVGGFLH